MPIATAIMKSCISLLSLLLAGVCWGQTSWLTPFEKDTSYSAHYHEAIQYFNRLDSAYAAIEMQKYGTTDAGYPLHLVVVNTAEEFDPVAIRRSGKAVLMVMNGIHPGESCGVDASMLWVRDLLQNAANKPLLDSVVLAIIPMYNIGGALDRSCCTRANQVGPTKQGFRGNAQYLDLNRDFAKADSRNMRAFTQLFQLWQPAFFIDTHTSNGADYQHTMTLIGTQQDKLHPIMADYMYDTLWPHLFQQMEAAGWPMTPYVMPVQQTPDNGLLAFLETPRYSTGYTALFNTIGFVSEAHMFKPFASRVRATYVFLQATLAALADDRKEVLRRKQLADEAIARQRVFPIQWTPDTTTYQQVLFKGYTDTMVQSAVTGQLRLQYDRSKPWEDSIKWYNRYRVTDAVEAPIAYVIPQAWQRVVQQLKENGVALYPLVDTVRIPVESYYIDSVVTLRSPWEGHYFHRTVAVAADTQQILYHAGDYIVFVNQPANRYIVEMLEPTAVDSWFRWNYFDAVLMQKEYFSGYVFDPLAADLLANSPALADEFARATSADTTLATNHYRQLDYIYKRSPYYEKGHNRYPITRLINNMTLPLAKKAE